MLLICGIYIYNYIYIIYNYIKCIRVCYICGCDRRSDGWGQDRGKRRRRGGSDEVLGGVEFSDAMRGSFG